MGRTKLTADDKTTMRPQVLLDDRPAHKVYLDAYSMDEHEVTNAQYAEFVKATGHRKPYHWSQPVDDKLPVFNVDWEDARSYCSWAGPRVPTEAESERGARAGAKMMDLLKGDKKKTKNQL